jgi:hypothetical protein
MMIFNMRWFTLFVALLWTGNCFAQQSVNAGAGEITGPSGSVSY